MKFLIITGGVMSRIVKGVTTSSIGVILKNFGLNVTAIKIDPYLNQDAGTISPYEHGECFILKDGGEVDLDLGNYERFLNISLTRDHNITMGKVYQEVLHKERKGDYLGKTVQVVPHITDHIQEWIQRVAVIPTSNDDLNEKPDICLIELGGTIGDIESMPFVEALRQLKHNLGSKEVFFLHVSYIPILKTSDEIKTKPTQHSMQTLRSLGIQPNILCLRCEKELEANCIKKLANYCQVDEKNIVAIKDVSNIYRIPLIFYENNIIDTIRKKLRLISNSMSNHIFTKWRDYAYKIDNSDHFDRIIITIVGKYTSLHDSYLSISHAIRHAALNMNVNVKIKYLDSSNLEDAGHSDWFILRKSNAIIIPGGFDVRGTEGMIEAIKYARINKIPILGICLGYQLQVLDIARNLADVKNATSEEFDSNPLPYPRVITKIDNSQVNMGGTMRLGIKKIGLENDSLVHGFYQKSEIEERHRHRYEINDEYWAVLQKVGLKLTGKEVQNHKGEILELVGHPYYLGCQFHPECNTYPHQPHPLFVGLIKVIMAITMTDGQH